MSDSGQVDHHRAVEYSISDYRLQTSGFTVTQSDDDRRIDVSGACPGCGGLTSTTWDYGTGNGYKAIFRRAASAPRIRPSGPRTVCCDCGHVHANRPDDAVFRGCGAYWQVELP